MTKKLLQLWAIYRPAWSRLDASSFMVLPKVDWNTYRFYCMQMCWNQYYIRLIFTMCSLRFQDKQLPLRNLMTHAASKIAIHGPTACPGIHASNGSTIFHMSTCFCRSFKIDLKCFWADSAFGEMQTKPFCLKRKSRKSRKY